MLIIARAQVTNDNIALPTTFRSVLYLDVFGWYDKPMKDELSSQRPDDNIGSSNPWAQADVNDISVGVSDNQ